MVQKLSDGFCVTNKHEFIFIASILCTISLSFLGSKISIIFLDCIIPWYEKKWLNVLFSKPNITIYWLHNICKCSILYKLRMTHLIKDEAIIIEYFVDISYHHKWMWWCWIVCCGAWLSTLLTKPNTQYSILENEDRNNRTSSE